MREKALGWFAAAAGSLLLALAAVHYLPVKGTTGGDIVLWAAFTGLLFGAAISPFLCTLKKPTATALASSLAACALCNAVIVLIARHLYTGLIHDGTIAFLTGAIFLLFVQSTMQAVVLVIKDRRCHARRPQSTAV